MNSRNETIDIAKAIGILLMILGHCKGIPFLLKNFIFSFHMPLFFILSGYFFKPQPIRQVLNKGYKHLVKPYLITSFFCIILCLIIRQYETALNKIIGVIMSNGGWPNEMIGSKLPYIGPIWFLLALFWCKLFYTFLKQKTENSFLYSFIISSTCLIIGKYIVNLPFGILTGFCGMVFYAMGDFWRNKMKMPLKRSYYFSGIIIWLFCIWKGHLELASFDCSFYPISMLAAFIGTYTTFLASSKVPSYMKPFLNWTGKNTLLIVCYHTLSFYIISNIKYYILRPYEVTFTSLGIIFMYFSLGLGLTYLHTCIKQRFHC